ncbi:MAG: DUF5717 family protein [Clostridiales bacterium]|nr:DUF5717 family protein [Clostridiales bacterium]
MRRKIQDIIRGTFEYDVPSLILTEEKLDFPVIENETYTGSFHLKSSTDEPVRGIVTCEHPNVRILTEEFDSDMAEIRFEFSGDRIAEGETQKGIFVVTSSCGEYLFPFRARISRHYLSSSIGKIKTINDFTNLCNLNWDEALKVFSSRFFCNIFHENEEYYTLLYRAVTYQRRTSHEMEEFLIASGRKKRCVFSVSQPKRTYTVRDKAIHASVDVSKSEWGYCDIRISCAESFIHLERNRLQMSDFIGKHAEFDFQIDPLQMHRGKNYATITLHDGFRTEQLILTCIAKGRQPDQMRLSFVSEDDMEEHSYIWKKRRCYYLLEKSFFSYCIKKKTESEWIQESARIIQQAEQAEIQGRWLNLFLAYIYWKAGDPDRMEERMFSVPRNTKTARTPLGAMYLYLMTLKNPDMNREEAYSRIRAIYTKYRSHPILTWIVLQTDEMLKRNPQRKYQWIRQYMTDYHSMSPILYLEAAQVLLAYPEILNSQDDFDFRLVCWISRKNLVNKELALRIQGMAQGRRSFSRSYFSVLSKCHKKFRDDSFVRTICVYLINTSRYGETYFPWFKRGVEQHLKIAGLYEAFMLSWSRSMGELPPEVVRYFSMNSSLPSRRKAMLFAYIIRNKNRLQRDWPAYVAMVKDFAVSELANGHMNDDLAVIYEELRRMMTVQEWEKVRKNAENCYKVHIGANPFVAVHVAQGGEERTLTRTTLTGDHAYIYLYHRPYVILYEGKNGQLYTSAEDCRVSKMLPGNNLYGAEADNTSSDEENPVPGVTLSDGERLEKMAGSIDEMTDLVIAARERDLPVVPQTQQLMIRMLFTGYLGENHEKIFQILAKDPESEELILAYISVLCRSFMLHDYPLSGAVYHCLGDRIRQKRRLNDYCTAAFVRMHLCYREAQYDALAAQMFESYLLRGNYFPFFSELSTEDKRRYLLVGIRVVSCQDRPGMSYFVELSDGKREACREVLPGLYTCPLRVIPGEVCEYSIVDLAGNVRVRESIREADAEESLEKTRYGMLGYLNVKRTDTKAQFAYAEQSDMVQALFQPIKE